MIPCLLAVSMLTGLLATTLSAASPSSLWVGGGALALGVLAAATWERRPLSWLLLCLLAAYAWGALLAPSSGLPPAFRGGLTRSVVEVVRAGCGESGCWAEAMLLACEPLEPESCPPRRSVLGIASPEELARGARLSALLLLRPRTAFLNRTGALAWPDLRAPVQGKLAPGSRAKLLAISPLDALTTKVRVAARATLEHSLEAPHAGVARALLLGEGAAVERELNDAIRTAGVSHVLAVSGMHVTLLVGALVALVRACWLRTPLSLHWQAARVGAAIGVLLAPLIAGLCGASPSALRAAFTSTVVYAVVAMGYKPCALSVTALVVMAHAALRPEEALHPGFVLSVLATAALLTHAGRARSAVRQALRESVRAWLATAAFLLVCFGQVSLIALLANVALLPLGGALVPLAAVHLLLATVGLAPLFASAPVLSAASGAFVEAARLCAALDPGLLVPPPTPLQSLALTASCALFLLPLATRVRVWLSASCLLAWTGDEWALRHALDARALRVTVVDVGQGDAILLETLGGTALIDAGGSLGGGPDPGAHALLPLLRARRIEELALVVLSHPHPDHYGGLAAVFAALPVRELWDTGQAEAELEGGEVARLLAQARVKGTRVRRPRELCGNQHELGPARLDVLAPCPAYDEGLEANDNSFVLRLTHGRRRFLFTGDAEQAREESLLAAGVALQADVLKVAHHGSRTSSTAALLEAVKPKLAVISAGRGNRFGHPHAEVLERLRKKSERVLRVDEVGGVQIESDGEQLQVRAYRDDVQLQL